MESFCAVDVVQKKHLRRSFLNWLRLQHRTTKDNVKIGAHGNENEPFGVDERQTEKDMSNEQNVRVEESKVQSSWNNGIAWINKLFNSKI